MPSPGPEGESLSSAISWHPARTPGVGDSSLPPAGPWLKPPGLGGGRGSISLAILGTQMDRHLPFGKPSL